MALVRADLHTHSSSEEGSQHFPVLVPCVNNNGPTQPQFSWRVPALEFGTGQNALGLCVPSLVTCLVGATMHILQGGSEVPVNAGLQGMCKGPGG